MLASGSVVLAILKVYLTEHPKWVATTQPPLLVLTYRNSTLQNSTGPIENIQSCIAACKQ